MSNPSLPAGGAGRTAVRGLKALLACLLIGALAPQASAKQNAGFGAVSISANRGGELYAYARNVSLARQQGRTVAISNYCQSACTLYLSLPPEQLCISVGTQFSFHRAYGASRSANEIGSQYMMSKYPYWVRNWINSHGGLSNRLIDMPYAYAAQFVPTCGRNGPTRSASRPSRQHAAPVVSRALVEQPVFAQAAPTRLRSARQRAGER